MSSEILKRDANNQPVIGLVTDDASQFIRMGRIDDATKGLKVMIVGGTPGTGTVTSVATGAGLTGGTITTTGTISLNSKLSPMDTLTGNSLKFLRVNAGETAVEYATVSGTGTVTSVSVTSANGISGVVATATTTPAITLSLGAITPTSIAGTSFIGNNTYSGANAFSSLPTCSATPANANDLVNKGYVDNFQQGLTVKASCDVATTANITLSGEQTIDGVLTSASRVLVKNQSTQANNGIYVSSAGAWTRATDYDQSAEVQAGTFCAVLMGTTQANTLWAQTTPSPTINVSPLVFTQLSSSGTGSVTSVSVVTANGVSGTVATATTTPAITLTLGAITPTTVRGLTITTTTGTFTLTNAKTLAVTNSLTLSGTDSTVMTFPTTTATIARTDAAQTFAGTQTFSQIVTTNNAITATANAATVPITSRISTVTNSSAATLTITLTTASAVDGMLVMVRVLDFSAAAQTISWVNTENSTVSVPTTSNGSTTLPLTVGFQFNAATSKWRCIASA